MTEKKFDKEGLKVAKRLINRRVSGVKIVPDPKNLHTYTWNPLTKTLALLHPVKEDMLHEVAHFLVAEEDDLCRPEFGIGEDPSRHYKGDVESRLNKEMRREAYPAEFLSCTVQWILAIWLGWDPKVVEQSVFIDKMEKDDLNDGFEVLSKYFMPHTIKRMRKMVVEPRMRLNTEDELHKLHVRERRQ